MTKKINSVSPIFPPYAGGMGSVAYYHAKELQKRGYEIEVFAPNYKEGRTVTEKYEGVKVTRVKPIWKLGNAAFVPELITLLNSSSLLRSSPPIIHLHYPFFGGAEAVWWLRKRKKIKLILHYHMDVVGKGFLKVCIIFYKKIFLPQIIKAADRIIVTSLDYAKHSDIKKFLQKYPKKFVEIPNGVDTERFFPSTKAQTRTVLFVGGLDSAHYFKGISYLLQSFQGVQNATLNIVGEGNMRHEYERQVLDLGIQEKVKFVGAVSSQDLPKYYNNAHVCVLPSIDKSEAFGMALVESMACKTPVIASDLAGVRTVVDDGVDGYLVRPKDVSGLTEKIQKILDNKEMAMKMGERGRRKVEEKYSWGKIGQNLEEVYDSL